MSNLYRILAQISLISAYAKLVEEVPHVSGRGNNEIMGRCVWGWLHSLHAYAVARAGTEGLHGLQVIPGELWVAEEALRVELLRLGKVLRAIVYSQLPDSNRGLLFLSFAVSFQLASLPFRDVNALREDNSHPQGRGARRSRRPLWARLSGNRGLRGDIA